MTSIAPPNPTLRVRGRRANPFAAVVMLLIQYCLGISINLYSTLPATDHGKSLFGGFTSAVGNGPVLLILHALLGTLLLITAVSALVRSARLATPPAIALSDVALVSIVVAWLSGSEFVVHMKNCDSLAMALATAVAILCYALVILVLGIPRRSPSGESSQLDAA
ncbi:MAG: hypothetical protein ACTHQQ_13905 [Solirubrobacteraceae bacterium]